MSKSNFFKTAPIEVLARILATKGKQDLPPGLTEKESCQKAYEAFRKRGFAPKNIVGLVGEEVMAQDLSVMSLDDLIRCLTVGPILAKAAWVIIKSQTLNPKQKQALRSMIRLIPESISREVCFFVRVPKAA